MVNMIDDFLRSLEDGTIGPFKKISTRLTIALDTVLKGANVSIDTLESISEIKGKPLAILNGVFGDTLDSQKSKLAIQMKLISEKPSSKICVFVHGLCASETSWQYIDKPNQSYGSLLEKLYGYTPVYVRYNSGLHISSNGKKLAKLLSDYCNQLAKPIEDVIFVGHSMGGLVVRSACYYANKNNASWVSKISKIFFLGTPHHGNDYEKLGNLTTAILKLVPNLVTKRIADLGNKRSAGIKDLRFGYLRDDDWKGKNPDAFMKDNRHVVPLLDGVDYFVIAGSVSKKQDNIFTQYFGDGMIPTKTAAGKSFWQSKSIPFPEKNFRIVKGVVHARLSRHPKVYTQIKKWCR